MRKMNGMTLDQLMRILRKTVIGQEDYLKKIAVTVWLHHKRIEAVESGFCDERLQKHNLLCVGPTGSGKTLAVTKLARIFDYDVIVTDMSAYTGSGWKGKDVEDMIQDLYEACACDRRRTERGIIVMDEIDKAILQNNDDKYPSFGSENALLKIVEGTKVSLKEVTIDTSNILFIAAGAFEGIEWNVKERVNAGKLGFKVNKEDFIVKKDELMKLITRQDILNFGMGAQFMGRFSDIAVLHKLSVQDLKKILLESDSSVVKDMNETLLKSCGVAVTMDEVGAEAVANEAIRENTGARSLAQIILPVIHDVMFLVDDDPTVNGILLTAHEGEPYVKLLEGERYKLDVHHPEATYCFPKPKRKNVEHFCWYLLKPYLDSHPEEFTKVNAMHLLLCSMVFYTLRELAPHEHTFKSLKKIIDTCYSDSGKNTLYEVLLKDVRKNNKNYSECVYYYERYRYFDRRYRMVGLLQKALDKFENNPPYFEEGYCRLPIK